MARNTILPELYAAGDTLGVMGHAAASTFGDTIRVLSWNVYKARHRNWRGDFTGLLADHDLILLQESVVNAGHDELFETGRFEWVMARSHKIRRNNTTTGVKTGSIVASSGQSFATSPDSEPILKTPKLLLATLYPVGESDKTLLVLNMHAINFVGLTKYRRQMAQIADAVRGHAGPVILGGDFNTWSAARLRHFFEVMAEAGLHEVPLTRIERLRHFNRHFDYIFYRGLTLENASVYADIASSDHEPLSATFRF